MPPSPRIWEGLFTQTITAPLVFVPGGGCAPTPAAQGAIAVVERFNADGSWIGTCGYTARAGFMKDSGAVAILYVYYDRDYGNLSRTALALPGISIGSIHSPAFVAWLQGNPTGASGTIEPEARRLPAEADILAGSSSRGPGYDWGLKPDITAPGNNILSSVTGALVSGGQPEPYFTQYSGTSMASPHVTGAAALVRSGHPDWTSAQVRSALINTSARAVKVRAPDGSLRDAAPYESGPGRLDLANAIDPGAVVDPPKASFGEVEFGDTADLAVTIASVSDDEETWSVAVEPHGGDGVVTVDKDTFTLAAGEETTLSLSFDSSAVAEDEHFGDVILSRGDTGQALRLVYFAYVSIPENRKDVLVVDWSYGDTPDYTSYYTGALDELGLTYDVWHAGEAGDGDDAVQAHPSFKTLQSYDLVILNTNESREPLIYTVAGAYQYQNYLLHGGNMLVAGQGDQDWWTIVGPNGSTIAISQNAGCEYCVPRYFAGFTFGLTATLSGKLLEYPEAVNKPEMEVVLAPHPEADGPFGYGLDISTGDMAKEDAAGNQYAFSSGSLVTGYVPTVEGAPPGVCTTAQGSNYCGDFDYAEVVFDHIVPYARPLWTYDGKVVGSYISGRHAPAEANIKWNAMFWGFGLEGVGKGGPDTVGRTELLGDVFSFLTGRLLTPPSVYLPWTAKEFVFGGGDQP
ncbi:MAG: S8 family serine peptidase [Anaerolineae bacterium]